MIQLCVISGFCHEADLITHLHYKNTIYHNDFKAMFVQYM